MDVTHQVLEFLSGSQLFVIFYTSAHTDQSHIKRRERDEMILNLSDLKL